MNAVQNNLLAYAGPQPEQVHSELHYMTARQLLSIFRRHRWLIGAIVAGVTLITAVAVFTPTPFFYAPSTVLVLLFCVSFYVVTSYSSQYSSLFLTFSLLFSSLA